MHFPVEPEQAAVGIQNRCGVVVDPGRAALKKRGHDDSAGFPRHAAQPFAGGAGDRFGEIKEFGVLTLTKVGRAEQLLQANDLCPAGGGLLNPGDRLVEIRLGFGIAAHLHQADGHGIRLLKCHLERRLPGRCGAWFEIIVNSNAGAATAFQGFAPLANQG